MFPGAFCPLFEWLLLRPLTIVQLWHLTQVVLENQIQRTKVDMFYVHVSPLVTEALRIQVFNRMLDKNDPNQ